MSRSRILLIFALLMPLAILLSAPAFAQYGAGLQGTVQDRSGAVVSGANITATEDATGIQHTATTNSSGFYRISQLPHLHGYGRCHWVQEEFECRCSGPSRAAARAGRNR